MTRQLLNQPAALLLLVAIMTVSTNLTAVQAAEEVTVKLKSGRSYAGFVDNKTTDAKLVLRFEGAATTLWRPIVWDRIVGARFKSEELGVIEFKELALQIKSKRAEIVPAASEVSPIDRADRSGSTMADRAHQALAGTSTLRSFSHVD